MTHRLTGDEETRACSGLFCFIGAGPATGWLTRVATDRNGFVLTDVQLAPDDLSCREEDVRDYAGRGALHSPGLGRRSTGWRAAPKQYQSGQVPPVRS